MLVPLALPDDALVPLPEATGEDDSDAPPAPPEVEVWELDSVAPPRLGVCS